jgi:dihydrofolate reductase
MGKVICLINITADGFCDSHYVIADAEFHEFVHGLMANTHTVGFGRTSFELFQQVWPPILEKEDHPQSQVKMARALDVMPKTVFSSGLSITSWNNSNVVRSIDVDKIIEMKQNNDKDLLTIGSPGLVASLTELKLVDDYYFCVQPVITGSGNVRLFDKIKLDARQPLKFMETTQLKSGVVINHYQRSN